MGSSWKQVLWARHFIKKFFLGKNGVGYPTKPIVVLPTVSNKKKKTTARL